MQLGRPLQANRSQPNAVSLQPSKADVANPIRLPAAPAAAPGTASKPLDDSAPQRWALRVSELTRPLQLQAQAEQEQLQQHSMSIATSTVHDYRWNGGDSQAVQSHDKIAANANELRDLLQRSLGPAASVWSARRKAEAQHQQLKQNVHELYRAKAGTDGTASAEDMAYYVCQYAKVDEFGSALQLMDLMAKHNLAVGLEKINQRIFLDSAIKYKQGAAVVAFLHALPKRFHDIRLYNMALQACAQIRDYARALEVMSLVERHRIKKDLKLLTTMINVCKSVGNAEAAFKHFGEMKAANMRLDAQVYGAVIASCAEAMLRELSIVHERKDQFVLMERAFQLVAEANSGGQALSIAVYNSLLVCAGRSGQLGRAFEVMDMIAAAKLLPDEQTFGALLEACIQAGKQQLAFKVFAHAVQEGHHTIMIYTQAISACKIEGSVNLAKALEIHDMAEKAGLVPDKKYYVALMAVSGKASKLNLALADLQAVTDRELVVGTTLANGLMYAAQQDISLVRQVYALCAHHGVYPEVSQCNRLMDWYSEHGRLGEVVSLVCDMVTAGMVPNLNTFRIIFNTCQKAGQAQLALEVYAAMKAKKIPILQEKYARTIFFTLIKTCLNQILNQWSTLFEGKPTPWKMLQTSTVRSAEAEKLLSALRSTAVAHSASTTGRATNAGGSSSIPPSSSVAAGARGPGGNGKGDGQWQWQGTGLLAFAPESINWQQQALMLYRDYLSTGYRPSLQVLDVMLRCLRLRLPAAEDASAAALALGASAAAAGTSAPLGPAGMASPFAGAGPSATGLGMPGTSSPLNLAGPHHHHHSTLGALALGLPGSFGLAATRSAGMPLGFSDAASAVPRKPWEMLTAGSTGHSTGSSSPSTSATLPSLPDTSTAALEQSGAQERRYEMLFDRRALSLLDDAMHKGLLPSVKGVDEGPMTFDLRTTPPTVAEVLLLSVLTSLDKRAAKTGRCQVLHNIVFVVPGPWEEDLATWPSYVQKTSHNHRRRKTSSVEAAHKDQVKQSVISYTELQTLQSALEASDSPDGRSPSISSQTTGGHTGNSQAGSMQTGSAQASSSEASSSLSSSSGADTAPLNTPASTSSRPSSARQAANDVAAARSAAAAMPLHGLPFSAADAIDAMRSPAGQPESTAPAYVANTCTSLALLAMCKRMKMFCEQDPERGIVTLSAKEMSRWLINRRQYVVRQQQHQQQLDGSSGEAPGSAAAPAGARQQQQGRGIAASQHSDESSRPRDIRTSWTSSDEEEVGSSASRSALHAHSGDGLVIMKRPKHRLPRRVKPKKPSISSSTKPSAPPTAPHAAPAAVPVVPTPVVMPLPFTVGPTATVDSGLTLGNGIQISVAAAKLERPGLSMVGSEDSRTAR